MWNAFGNGSSGYVSKADGWEFVPCSRLQRGTKRVQSPVRVRSFPAADGHFLEQTSPGSGSGSGSGATASDATGGQNPHQELQNHHSRLKKKLEELKKRYDQEREEWRMEKEILLRQVAEIQGGENRRILLDLRSVLEEVQLGIKREESKRSDLELQYIKDRCAWDVERTELKSRISQLETRGCSVVVETVKSSELGDTLKRERAEQKRLLEDTHSAAMDLRCRLETSEKGWVKEKSELLERFDTERKEWETQLMDMQRKIEELYDEVKAHRKGNALRPNADPQNSALRLSTCSASTLSSALTYPSEAQSNEYLTQQSNASTDSPSQHSHKSNESNKQCNELLNQQGNMEYDREYERGAQQAIDTAELEEILESCLKTKLGSSKSCLTGEDDLLNPFKGFQSMDISCGTDKKKNNTALNAALKEIARVSEELCSYQDEKGKWPDIKRSRTEKLFFPGEAKMVEKVKDKLEIDDTEDIKNWSEELKTLDEQYWTNWEGFNTEAKQTQSDALSLENIRQAPPIPTRSTSWYLNSPPSAELESSGPESLTARGYRSENHLDRKYSSPAIVRRFEAMLQENEGKVLIDSANVSCIVPVDSKCNIGCCQSRWSCDGNRFGSNKSSKYVPVQKCLSNVDIAAAENSVNQIDAENKNDLRSASHPMSLTHMPTDSVTSLDIDSPYVNVTTPKNERLEQKTAELNRTLFQAGMGLRCDEEGFNSVNVSADHAFACTPDLPTYISQDSITDCPSLYVEDSLKDVLFDLMAQCPKDECLEISSYKSPQSETKDSKSSSQQQDVSLKELNLGLSDHASIRHTDSSSLKTNFITPTTCMKDRVVEPSRAEHNSPSITQIDKSVGDSLKLELTESPSQMKSQIEKSSKIQDVGPERKSKQPKHAKPDACNIRSRILDENPWKPSTLAAYPRPVESRSNYGAVERILKNYEDMDRSQEQQQSQPSPGKEEDFMDLLEMLDIRHQSRSSQRLTHTPHHQVIAHKETHVTVQQNKEPSVTIKKSFSRPACPAKRRLPSRWANRSFTSSISSSSPPQTTTPTIFTQRQTLTYSAYHIETVI